MQNFVRSIAIAVIQREKDAAILVAEGYDSHSGETFYRPLGGTIEFGEPSAQTVRRELKEEAGLELCDVRYCTTLENIFEYQGGRGHEIVIVYTARLAESAVQTYEVDEFQAVEDNGQSFTAKWMPLQSFSPGGSPLYPTGLLEVINERN